MILAGHASEVRCVEFSSDGTLMLTASERGPVRIWSVAGGTCLQMLSGHKYGVTEASFSFDRKFVLAAGFGSIAKMWNIGSGRCEKTFAAHPEAEGGQERHRAVCTAQFSPDGTSVLTTCILLGLEVAVKIWNAFSGVCLREFFFIGLHSCICNVSFDGSCVIIVPKVAHFPRVSADEGTAIAWNEAMARVSSRSRDECKVTVWRIATGELTMTLCGHSAPVTSLAEAPFKASRPHEARVPSKKRSKKDVGFEQVKRICC